MIIDKYKKEIEDTIKFLEGIKSYNFDSANVYGSSFSEGVFREGYSDIDMIFMSDNFDMLDLHEIVNEIDSYRLDFKEKRPMIIDDNLCKRIEFYIKYPTIPVDITLAPGLIPSLESLETNVWHDNFEALMGGVYLNSKSVYGAIPDYDLFMKEYYPFYGDDLREKRLNILANRIGKTNEYIDNYVKEKNLNLTDNIYKIRKHFIQFLYIYYRKYYISPDKHTYYQLDNILHLPEEEKQILCFAKGDLYEAAKAYLELSNDYLERYNKEKVLKRSK